MPSYCNLDWSFFLSPICPLGSQCKGPCNSRQRFRTSLRIYACNHSRDCDARSAHVSMGKSEKLGKGILARRLVHCTLFGCEVSLCFLKAFSRAQHHKSRISFGMLSLGQTVETQIGDSNKHERERNRNRPPVVTRLGETRPDYDGPRYQRHQHSHIEH